MEHKTEEMVLLTGTHLEKLGDEVAGILHIVDLQNQLLDHVTPLRKIQPDELVVYYNTLYNSTNTMYEVNRNLIEKLDNIAHALFNATDLNELKACKLFDIKQPRGE